MQRTYQNLTIRNATPADAILLSAWWNDGAIMSDAGYHYGTGETPDMIADKIQKEGDMTARRLIVEEAQPDFLYKDRAAQLQINTRSIPIGEMNYLNVGHGIAEIGLRICNFSRHNKGYGHILLSMLIDELFRNMHFQQIITDINLKDKRTQHVYESLGFVQTDYRDQAYRNSKGQWQTAVYYKLLPENFHSFLK